MMSLSDCRKCWDNPCTCGYSYENYTPEYRRKLIDAIEKSGPVAPKEKVKIKYENNSRS